MIDTVPLDKRTPGLKDIAPLIRPHLAELYTRRAARLRQLAHGHDAADYLGFAASVVDAQGLARAQLPPLTDPLPPLALAAHDLDTLAAADDWPAALQAVLDALEPGLPEPARAAASALRALGRPALDTLALALLQGRHGEVDARFPVFLWAALSLAWARRAAHAAPSTRHPADEVPTSHALCPVCGCMPVASLVLTGDRAGLRYLQCALCETRWHMVRAKCSNCDSAAALDYWSFDATDTTAKAESCGDCRSYLKIFYQEKDAAVEAVADDLASLALDEAVEGEGFARTGMNPFAFPG